MQREFILADVREGTARPCYAPTVQISSKSRDFRFKRIVFNYRLFDARRLRCINVAICDVERASVACDIKHVHITAP